MQQLLGDVWQVLHRLPRVDDVSQSPAARLGDAGAAAGEQFREGSGVSHPLRPQLDRRDAIRMERQHPSAETVARLEDGHCLALRGNVLRGGEAGEPRAYDDRMHCGDYPGSLVDRSPITIESGTYSARSATDGSTLDARQAGIAQATAATRPSTSQTATKLA